MRRLLFIVLVLSAAPAESFALTLYDGGLGTLMTDQGWVYDENDPGGLAAPAAGGSGTVLDTTADAAISAGFAYSAMPSLSSPFTVSFEVQVNSESHLSADRSGFSVILLDENSVGIELGFWTNEIWAQDDAPVLFVHDEGVAYDTTAMTSYELLVDSGFYYLSAEGSQVLTGAVRDYSAHPNPVYSTPNFLFMGDNTTSADASFEIAGVDLVPEPATLLLIAAGVVPVVVKRRRRSA